MTDKNNKHLTFIVYDSICNSVFQTVVLVPLLKLLKQSDNLVVTLISFEPVTLRKKHILNRIPAHDRLHLVLCRRIPFIGKLSLRLAAFQLRRILKYLPSHEIIARGPLAGWMVMHALKRLAQKNPERMRAGSPYPLPEVTIQARGLCAQEYRFFKQQNPVGWLKNYFHQYIYRQLHEIEFEVYRNKRKTDYPNKVEFEAVSIALKDYLVTEFRAEAAHITIAINDIPRTLTPDEKTQWRSKARDELKFTEDTHVIAYSGSAKPWQCITEMMLYFMQELQKNRNVHFLVLSQDEKQFRFYFEKMKIDKHNYTVLNVPAIKVLMYLCAADTGLLFRRKDIINWVSRPTKLLEYQAVGLKIEHNDTIEMLVRHKKKATPKDRT